MARPAGSPNKDKPFRDALRMEIAEAGDDRKRLRRIANALLSKAEEGDVQAIKEVGDRLDGKPAQEQHNTNETTIRYVARLPEKAANAQTWQKQHSPPQTIIQ